MTTHDDNNERLLFKSALSNYPDITAQGMAAPGMNKGQTFRAERKKLERDFDAFCQSYSAWMKATDQQLEEYLRDDISHIVTTLTRTQHSEGSVILGALAAGLKIRPIAPGATSVSFERPWKIRNRGPKDNFLGVLTVQQWVEKRFSNGEIKNLYEGWAEFLDAKRIYDEETSHQPLQCELVGYDIKRDKYFFIFKANNNGSTYTVSK